MSARDPGVSFTWISGPGKRFLAGPLNSTITTTINTDTGSMAQLPVAGPSQPSSATKKSPKPRSASKSKPRAPDVGSAATSPVRPHATEMDVDESPAAESSTAAMNGGLLSTLGPHTNGSIASTSKRKHRHGNKESKGVGPSETPRKRYQREGVEECACIPIARAGVSSIPPVWSRDSRCVS